MPPVTTSPVHEVLLENLEWARQLAMGMARDSHLADDLVQEAFRIGLEKPPQKASKARAWLAQVMRNNLRLYYRGGGRRRGREQKVAVDDYVDSHPLAPMEREESMQAVSRTLLGLPEPFQGTLVLHYWDHLSLQEIADRTGAPVRTVESRLRKGRQLMKERLNRQFDGDNAWAIVILPLLSAPSPPTPLLKSAVASTACLALILGGIAIFGSSPQSQEKRNGTQGMGEEQAMATHAPLSTATPTLLKRESVPVSNSMARLSGAANSVVEIHLYDEATGESLPNIAVPILQYGDLEAALARGVEPLGVLFKKKYWAVLAKDSTRSNEDGLATIEAVPGALYIQVGDGLFSSQYSMLELEGAAHRRITRTNQGWPRLELPLIKRFGSARGHIVNSTSQEAIEGATLQFWQGNFIKPPRPPEFETIANVEGSFEMNQIISERRGCSLSAVAPGWVSPFVYRAWPDFGPDFRDIRFPLVPAQPLAIQVVDENGAPVPEARVTVAPRQKAALPPSIEGGSFIHRSWPAQLTDAEGNVVFDALPDGLRVEVRAANFGFCSVTIPNGTVRYVVHLDRGVTVAGRVVDEQGQPLEGARMTLFCAEGALPTQTDREGHYQFTHVHRGQNVRLQLHKKNYAWWVSEPLDTSAFRFFEITAVEAQTIMGRVTPLPNGIDFNQPLLTASPVAMNLFQGLSSAMWTPSFECVLLSDGRFVVKGLPAGDFLLKFTTPQGAVWTHRASAGEHDIVLGPDPDLQLQKISGTVFRDGDTSTVGFAQLQAFRVDRLFHARTNDQHTAMTMMAPSVAANAHGQFELPALPPGQYSLCCWDPESGRHFHHVLNLPEDAMDSVDIFLPAIQSFDLLVQTAEGAPVAKARLHLVASNGIPHPLLVSTFPNRKIAEFTNEQGKARLENIPLDRDLVLLVDDTSSGAGFETVKVSVSALAAHGDQPYVIVLE
jgi:RNA polymerase sigma-70 factor (ECF subfamily)